MMMRDVIREKLADLGVWIGDVVPFLRARTYTPEEGDKRGGARDRSIARGKGTRAKVTKARDRERERALVKALRPKDTDRLGWNHEQGKVVSLPAVLAEAPNDLMQPAIELDAETFRARQYRNVLRQMAADDPGAALEAMGARPLKVVPLPPDPESDARQARIRELLQRKYNPGPT